VDQKKPPPVEAADRLVTAVQAYQAARIERDQAIAAALNAGGSTRQVGEVAGLSQTRVRNIGAANGYPDARLTREREKAAAERARWDAYWDAAIAAVEAHRQASEHAIED
jgi:hypothetical protein